MTRPAACAAIVLALLAAGGAAAAPGEHDLAYASDALQRLDLVLPAGKGFPTVLFVHGGSLTTGDKSDDDYRNVCAPFPAAGIACASMNYRLGPAHAWPAQAEDVAAAVAWLKGHIAERGGDPSKVFLFGHSSGALLVAVVGADARYLAKVGMKPADLRGVVPMGSIMWDDELDQAIAEHGRARVAEAFAKQPDYAMYGSLESYLDLWPIRHVHAGLPPFLFLIAEAEQEHPPVLKTDRKFVEDARAAGNSAAYRVLPGRTHYSAIRNLNAPNDPVFAIIRDFVQKR